MIKLFEEYNEYYYEIGEDEFENGSDFNNGDGIDGILEFTPKEIEYIDKIYPAKKSYGSSFELYYAIDNNSWMYIYKLHDEWFTVKYKKWMIKTYCINSHYKCDQLEGLKKLIKDIYDKVI